MKKLLLLGAILMLGSFAYGSSVNEINGTEGRGSLGLITTGSAMDVTNSVVLEVRPTLSAGIDGNSLEFNFGDLLPGASEVRTGKFKAQVLNKGVPVVLDNNTLNVTVKGADGTNMTQQQELKNTAGVAVGKILYSKAGGSGFIDTGKTYEGIITSAVNIDNKKEAQGTFADNGAFVKIQVTQLEIPNN